MPGSSQKCISVVKCYQERMQQLNTEHYYALHKPLVCTLRAGEARSKIPGLISHAISTVQVSSMLILDILYSSKISRLSFKGVSLRKIKHWKLL